MSSYWSNFARSGDPNGRGLPPWPAFTNATGRVLCLGDPVSLAAVANLDSLTALDGVYAAVRGKPFGER
jgi:para-nitrobenzyl esterase